MISQPINYRITGENLRVLEMILKPGETILAEAGALIYMDEGIVHETCLGDGSEPNPVIMEKIFPSAIMPLSGDSIFYTYFTNYGRKDGVVLFSTPYIGTPVKLNLSDFNNELIILKGAFLCAPKGVKISAFNPRKNGVITKNELVTLHKISGEGDVFINVGGSLIERNISSSDSVRIDATSILAFDARVELTVENIGDVKTMLLGNDAFVLASLKGDGKVLMQSLPLQKMILYFHNFVQHMHLTNDVVLRKLYED